MNLIQNAASWICDDLVIEELTLDPAALARAEAVSCGCTVSVLPAAQSAVADVTA